MKANSAKAKQLAQSGWSKDSIEHLKADLRIKSSKPKLNISQPIKDANKKDNQQQSTNQTAKSQSQKANVIKEVDYKKHRINPNLYDFRQWLHKSEYRFLILDLEFYITGNKGPTKENTHIMQVAGQVFNDFDRFNYYNLNKNMKTDSQLEVLRQTNAQYSELKPSDQFPDLAKRIRRFVKAHEITHIISWGNGNDIATIRYWEHHYKLDTIFGDQIKWIDLASITGCQLTENNEIQHTPSLKNFYKTFGLLDNNISWHHADQDVKAINQICHVYYGINNHLNDLC